MRRQGGDLEVDVLRATGEVARLRASWLPELAAGPPEPAPLALVPPATTNASPPPTPPVARTLPLSPEESEAYQRQLEYRRQSLRVQPLLHGVYPGRPVGHAVPHYAGTPWMGSGWALGFAPPVPQALARAGFVIVRGDGTMVSEMELAQLTQSPELEREIRARRRDRQLAWAFGFGAAALGGVGMGAVLLGDHDTRTAGSIFLGVGIVSGLVALLAHNAGGTPALNERQAVELATRYNRELRQRLGLEPEAQPGAP
jgi:hypothetical protein